MDRNEKGQFTKGGNIIDLTGRKFGKLKVLYMDKERTNRKTYWICECECGNIKSIRSDCLRVIQSCGCVQKKQQIINLGIKYNHNMTYHPLFPVWDAMMNRCYNEKQECYKNYGGRGIKVCPEWHDVKLFCKWAEESGWKKGLTIERKDVNKNYEPSNCEWIPSNEQAWNTRKTVYADINGEKVPLAKTARQLGINPRIVLQRWKRGERKYEKLFFNGNLHTEYKG